MTTLQIIAAICRRTDLSKEQVSTLLQGTTEIITDNLLDGKSIHIQDFGDLEVRKKNERVNVNPKTGVRTLTPPKLQLCFKQNTRLKEAFTKGE